MVTQSQFRQDRLAGHGASPSAKASRCRAKGRELRQSEIFLAASLFRSALPRGPVLALLDLPCSVSTHWEFQVSKQRLRIASTIVPSTMAQPARLNSSRLEAMGR